MYGASGDTHLLFFCVFVCSLHAVAPATTACTQLSQHAAGAAPHARTPARPRVPRATRNSCAKDTRARIFHLSMYIYVNIYADVYAMSMCTHAEAIPVTSRQARGRKQQPAGGSAGGGPTAPHTRHTQKAPHGHATWRNANGTSASHSSF